MLVYVFSYENYLKCIYNYANAHMGTIVHIWALAYLYIHFGNFHMKIRKNSYVSLVYSRVKTQCFHAWRTPITFRTNMSFYAIIVELVLWVLTLILALLKGKRLKWLKMDEMIEIRWESSYLVQIWWFSTEFRLFRPFSFILGILWVKQISNFWYKNVLRNFDH